MGGTRARWLAQALAAIFAVAGAALADPPDAAPTAAPGSIALGMIENADAVGVFDILDDGQTSVRHLGSGLVCRFQRDGEGGRIMVFPGLPRGDDVACEFADPVQNIRLYATRLPRAASLDEIIAAAADAVRRAAPGAEPYVASEGISAAGGPPSRSAQFLIPNADGGRDYMRVSVAQIGAWTFKQRFRAPAPDDAAVSRMAERSALMWRGELSELAH